MSRNTDRISTVMRREGLPTVAAACAVAIAANRSQLVSRADACLLSRVLERRRPSWRRPALAITALGETPVMVAIVVATCGRQPRRAARHVAVLGATLALRAFMCRMLHRARPDPNGWWAEPTGFSMPSRHTMTAVLGLSLIAERVPGRFRSSATAGTRIAGVAVAATRVVLGVHWPTDTVAGYLLGSGFGALATADRQRARRVSCTQP